MFWIILYFLIPVIPGAFLTHRYAQWLNGPAPKNLNTLFAPLPKGRAEIVAQVICFGWAALTWIIVHWHLWPALSSP